MGETQCKCQSEDCKPCGGADPNSDTVKVDGSRIDEVGKENQPPMISLKAQEDAAKAKEPFQEHERQRKEEEAADSAAAKEAADVQAAEEREQAAQAEQERLQAEEKAREEEEEAERQRLMQQEEAEKKAAEELCKAEEEKARKQQEEDKAKVENWLKKNGFAGINTPKKSCSKTSYALHVAVSKGEADIVGCLCRCGADKTVKSSKQTPLELAEKNSKKGSPEATACVTALSEKPAAIS